MNKRVQVILKEEREVFSFNINSTQKELTKSVVSFIHAVNEHVWNLLNDNGVVVSKKEANSIIIEQIQYRLISLNTNFINSIIDKRKSILENYIRDNKMYTGLIEKDDDIVAVLNTLDFYSEISLLIDNFEIKYNISIIDKADVKKLIKEANKELINKIKKNVLKTFDSILKYLKDIQSDEEKENVFVFISNHTNKTIYFEVKKVLDIEKQSVLSLTESIKKEMIGALESVVPKERKAEVVNYLHSNYTNIVSLVYSKYANYLLDEVYKIITSNKCLNLTDLQNYDKPFLEMAQKNSKPKHMDSSKISEPIIYNIVIKMYGTYYEEDYQKVNMLLKDYMDELNNIMLEKIESVPGIILDIVAREKNDSINIIKEFDNKKVTMDMIKKRFKEQEIYDKNLSSDDFRI